MAVQATSQSAEGADLEIGEHPHFEIHWQRIQMALFTIMLLLVAAGLAGLFGSGPLSASTAAIKGAPFSIEYPRFARARATTRIVIHPVGAPGGEVPIEIDRELAEALKIESIAPAPIFSGSSDKGNVYLVALAPSAKSPIVFQAQPEQPGRAKGIITVGGASHPVDTIVWP